MRADVILSIETGQGEENLWLTIEERLDRRFKSLSQAILAAYTAGIFDELRVSTSLVLRMKEDGRG